MASTESWAWYSSDPWPGFFSGNPDTINSNGNGLVIDPDDVTSITWNDTNNDGQIFDSDTDDASTSTGDSVTVDGQTKVVKEIGNYTDSTMVHDGVTYTVPMAVWVFEDGTYMVRIADSAIPPGSHEDVTALQLGTWDTTDYSASQVTTRDDGFVCFVAGTLIETATGLRPVEALIPGDLVLTLDHGLQPLRWIGARCVAGDGPYAPVRFAPGALHNTRALYVSPQHRMLVSGWQAELLMGEPEVLVAARHLINATSIRIAPCATVTYLHLLFDRHELVRAEGIFSESFHPNAHSLTMLDVPTRDEVLGLFPALRHHPKGLAATARPCALAHEARLITAA